MNPFRMRFSSAEMQDITKAWLVISLSFAMLNSGGFALTGRFLLSVAISALTVGVGFLLHELMHKYLAQKYGCRAEFRAFDFMLLIALLLAFFRSPILFAAPGAVFIGGNVNLARNGRISAAGPATNIVLSALFVLAAFAIKSINPSPILLQVASYGASVNAWLAVFNLLPFMGLDGSKVLRWNLNIYGIMMAASIAMMVLSISVM